MARKVEKASTERSRCLQRRKHLPNVFRPKTSLAKVEARLPSSCIPHKGENVYLAKTCTGKAVKLLTERKRRKQRRKRVYQGKTHLPSENAFLERKRSSQSFNRVYRAKTYLGKAKKPLPSENVARKCEPHFRSLNAFSLGYRVLKHIFVFANITFSRKNRFRLCHRRFRSVNPFETL